jgi:hypothetical protein
MALIMLAFDRTIIKRVDINKKGVEKHAIVLVTLNHYRISGKISINVILKP